MKSIVGALLVGTSEVHLQTMPATITVSPRMITAGHLAEGSTPGRYVLGSAGGLVDWTTEQPARPDICYQFICNPDKHKKAAGASLSSGLITL
jgi:hypothetical protein